MENYKTEKYAYHATKSITNITVKNNSLNYIKTPFIK